MKKLSFLSLLMIGALFTACDVSLVEVTASPVTIVGWELVDATPSSRFIINFNGFAVGDTDWKPWTSPVGAIVTDASGNGAETFAAPSRPQVSMTFLAVLAPVVGGAPDWGNKLAVDGTVGSSPDYTDADIEGFALDGGAKTLVWTGGSGWSFK